MEIPTSETVKDLSTLVLVQFKTITKLSVSTRRKIVLRKKDPEEIENERLLREKERERQQELLDNSKGDVIFNAAQDLLKGYNKRVQVNDLPAQAQFLFRKYQNRLIFTTFYSWRRGIGNQGTKYNNKKLVHAFLYCLPLHSHNSLRQLKLFGRSIYFNNKNLSRYGFNGFVAWRLAAIQADMKTPMAVNHYQMKFQNRLTNKIFSGFKWYTRMRQYKIAMRLKGTRRYEATLMTSGTKALLTHRKSKQNRRQIFNSAVLNHNISHQSRSFSYFLVSHLQRMSRKLIFVESARHCDSRVAKLAITSMILYTFTRYSLRNLFSLAMQYDRRYHLLNVMIEVRRSLEKLQQQERLVDAYRASVLTRKVFKGLLVAKLGLAQMQNLISADDIAPNIIDRMTPLRNMAAIVIQSYVRRYIARQYVRVFRVKRVLATMQLQQMVRRFIARKVRRSKQRHRAMAERMREEEREREMWKEECSMRFFLYQEIAILRIQRCYRGRLARELFSALRIEVSRGKSIGFYEGIKKTLDDRRRYLAEEPHRFRIRTEAAVMIQKHLRGMLGKAKALQRRHDVKVTACLSTLQRFYRIKLAKRKLAGYRRALVNDYRIDQVAKFRGLLFRTLGIRKKKSQRKALEWLQSFGLSPDSFEFRVNVLLRETLKDGLDLFSGLNHHSQEWINKKLKRVPTPSFQKYIERQNKLKNQQEIHLHDAVKICESGHAYMGHTGLVVRIDPSHNLVEIMLDKTQNMTDIITGTRGHHEHDPLFRVDINPDAKGLLKKWTAFPINDKVLDYSKTKTLAAFSIQRAWRRRLAFVKSTGKRYDVWLKEVTRQKYSAHILAELNITSQAAYEFLKRLRVMSDLLTNDYIKFPLRPLQIQQSFDKVANTEEFATKKDFEIQVKKRDDFVLKVDAAEMSNYFQIGLHRLTFFRKLSALFWRDEGLVLRSEKAIDFVGSFGLRRLRKRDAIVTGTDMYTFPQLLGSYHIRYDKLVLYQGEWGGIPFVSKLKPHGEGLIVFLSAWRFCREKVLFLTVAKCGALPINKHGVYCVVACAGQIRQTATKTRTINPEFNETFEIDVTDPSTKIIIELMEKDKFHDDFCGGMIEFPLSRLTDGEERSLKLDFKGAYFYDKFTDKEKRLRMREEAISGADKRGYIQLKMQWSERLTIDDMQQKAVELKSVILLQRQARILLSKQSLQQKKILKEKINEKINEQATKLASLFRMRIAKRKLNIRRREHKLAIKVQCRIRIYLSKNVTEQKRKRRKAATRIQSLVRGFLSRKHQKVAAILLAQLRNASASIIQRNFRRELGSKAAKRQRLRIESEKGKYVAEPVINWINHYGIDQHFRLRRNRRFVFRALSKLLRIEHGRIVSRFGIVFIKKYIDSTIIFPVQPLKMGELQGANAFVDTYLPAFALQLYSRRASLEKLPYNFYLLQLHIPSSIDHIASVSYYAILIQCMVRMHQSRQKLKRRKLMMRFAVRLQRRFRYRRRQAEKIVKALFRNRARALTKKMIMHMRLEKMSALKIQCALRCAWAREIYWQHRRLKDVQILKYSCEIHPFLASNCLIDSPDFYWMVETTNFAEIVLDLTTRRAISEIGIMTSTFASTPRKVTISVFKPDKTYEILIGRADIEYQKKMKWQKFYVSPVVTKYVKVLFEGNFDDPYHTAIRGITIIQAQERSAKILQQPCDHLIERGPVIGDKRIIKLSVKADGWPEPSFQWYCNGMPMLGERLPELELCVHCPMDEMTRTYRCIKCKMICSDVSVNIYSLICGNCKMPYRYAEILEYDTFLTDIKQTDIGLLKERKEYETLLRYLSKATFKYKNREIAINETKLQAINHSIRKQLQGRLFLKSGIRCANNYQSEGQYYCTVTNIRGGSIEIVRKSNVATIVVETPEPSVLKMKPFYSPRQRVLRRHWGVYKSILGSFVDGSLSGIVRIMYEDGGVYEGPYVEEKYVDSYGRVNSLGRRKDHYGYFTCPRGRLYEGDSVDNHFSPNEINGTFKLTIQNSLIYDGEFCDERMHGIGRCHYISGDIYEGQFHRNYRFGYGHYRSMEGWVFEGEYIRNRRHGRGSMRWSDGGYYIGEWILDRRHGKGILITRILDVYRGQFSEDHLCGYGEMLYSNGSRYTGLFLNSVRHGEGRLVEKNGNEFYGEFRDDEKHGDFVVKQILNFGDDCPVEIRIGQYENGVLVSWKRVLNRKLTIDFISLFYTDRSNFDGVYSMFLAKHLPNIPVGLDPDNQDVQLIIERIRQEGGSLVSETPLLQALDTVKLLLKPIRETDSRINLLKKCIEELNLDVVLLGFKKKKLEREVIIKDGLVLSNSRELEHYWQTENTRSRDKFSKAYEHLRTIPKIEYQFLKTHHVPPHFIKKLMNCVCFLLSLPTDWDTQRLLLSDHLDNVREGDADALIYPYDCKLVHILKGFDVYQHVAIDFNSPEGKLAASSLADPRYNRDSFYIRSCGLAAQAIIDLVKAAVEYLSATKRIRVSLNKYKKDEVELSRIRVNFANISKQYAELSENLQNKRTELQLMESHLEFLNEELEKADDLASILLLAFRGKERAGHGLDYYSKLELELEQKVETLALESCIEYLRTTVEVKVADERHRLLLQSAALHAMTPPDPIKCRFNIRSCVSEEVSKEFRCLIASGKSLDSNAEPGELSEEEVLLSVTRCARRSILRINDYGNELLASSSWIMLNGKKISSRCIYVLTWKIWREEVTKLTSVQNIVAWEAVFISPEKCARMAIESKVNFRMSAKVKRQADTWAEAHSDLIKETEITMAQEFEENTSDVASSALEVLSCDPRKVKPEVQAQAWSWNKVNPKQARIAIDLKQRKMAVEFEAEFGIEAAKRAVAYINGLNIGGSTFDNNKWREYGLQWKAMHTDEYIDTESRIISSISVQFAHEFPVSTQNEAARIIINSAIYSAVHERYPTAETAFAPSKEDSERAKCWSIKNSAKAELGIAYVNREFKKRFEKNWSELELSTGYFRLGSKLFVKESLLDSFAEKRSALVSKYSWLIGYLLNRYGELLATLDFLRSSDPLQSIVEIGIRPSTLKEMKISTIRENMRLLEVAEHELMGLTGYLSTWNSYFGC